jgi:hypothetical protein
VPTSSGPCPGNGANQFPIAHADPPGALVPAVSFFGGFRTPALVPVDRSALAGIRNPSHNRTQAAQRCFVASEQRPTVHGMRGAKILATNGSINRKRGTNLSHEANNGRRVYPHSGTGE